jgi:hypothetical protein
MAMRLAPKCLLRLIASTEDYFGRGFFLYPIGKHHVFLDYRLASTVEDLFSVSYRMRKRQTESYEEGLIDYGW